MLATEAVHHVGTPVAFVVAETAAAARDGAEAILVEYDILPSVTDLAAALDPGRAAGLGRARPATSASTGRSARRTGPRSMFRAAAHVTRLTVVNNRIVVSSMEARAALAEYDAATGRWTLRTNTQGGWGIKQMLGEAVFKTSQDNFRIITPGRRRRLRHEAVPLSRARADLLRRAQARTAR